MYKITRSLDLRSQRNVFLCSSQLYSKWQLHVPDRTDSHLIELSVNLLETATFGGLCDTSWHNTYIKINFGAMGPGVWRITCREQECRVQYTLSQTVGPSGYSWRGSVVWHDKGSTLAQAHWRS